MQELRGIGSSLGIAIGPVFVARSQHAMIDAMRSTNVDHEIATYRDAKGRIERELAEVAQRAQLHSPTLASIVETHGLIVGDPIVSQDIESMIRSGDSAAHAVATEFSKQARIMLLSTNSLIRDRAADIQQVQHRLLAELQAGDSLEVPTQPSIIVAHSLSPSQMFTYAEDGALGFICEDGGIDSHISIIARDLGLPALVSVHGATTCLDQGAMVILDATANMCLIDPSQAQLVQYQDLIEREAVRIQRQRAPVQGAITMRDGQEVFVLANVDNASSAIHANAYNAHGIGLVRTEMMLSGDGTFPSIEEQTAWYAKILRTYQHGPVTFRVFDIGGDKFGSYSPYKEENPALGLRGIRFLLAQPKIFEDQIIALLRASEQRRVRIMLPMITSYAEVMSAREIIDACRVHVESILGNVIDVQIGIMIETPASAVLADVLAKNVDFISIGTNDLTQYTLAADRTNELVSNMYDCIHPSVIRLMLGVVQAARESQIDVNICGEMAAQLMATEVLLGIGVKHFSVTPHVIPELQRRIQTLTTSECCELVEHVVACRTSDEVRAVIHEHQKQRNNGLSHEDR